MSINIPESLSNLSDRIHTIKTCHRNRDAFLLDKGSFVCNMKMQDKVVNKNVDYVDKPVIVLYGNKIKHGPEFRAWNFG